MKIYIWFLLLLLICNACYTVDVSRLKLEMLPIKTCANIYVLDQRPYVLSGNKTPDFLGLIRGGYGNPFDFNTSTGNPLAKDLGKALQCAITSSNGGAKYIDSSDVSKSNLNGCKTLVFKFKEWKIDAMVNAWFMHDSKVEIYSANGELIAGKQSADKRAVSGSFWSSVTSAKKNFLKESKRVVGEYLTDPQIKLALEN